MNAGYWQRQRKICGRERNGVDMKVADISQAKEIQSTAGVTKEQTRRIHAYTAHESEEEGATVAISAEGLGLSQKEDTSRQEAIERKMYQEMLESANEAAEAQGEGFADLAKALEIARRILNGDIVPAQDEQFLMEFNSEIYMRVKSMARVKEDPKEYDTLMEEEEEETAGENSAGESSPESLDIESVQQSVQQESIPE
ncbi:MAG: hypothetical protein NC314_06935 [Roseburia sp.]|nr:hypothetical protein [Roseburia sp.]MCM1242562.1 hypothetical protein [Roseburia sp.]